MDIKIINLTPHEVRVGDTVYPTSGLIARISTEHVEVEKLDGKPVYSVKYGDIENLPDPVEGTLYIVSLLLLERGKLNGRKDLVAPASGAPGVIRKDGQIYSVPGFVI